MRFDIKKFFTNRIKKIFFFEITKRNNPARAALIAFLRGPTPLHFFWAATRCWPGLAPASGAQSARNRGWDRGGCGAQPRARWLRTSLGRSTAGSGGAPASPEGGTNRLLSGLCRDFATSNWREKSFFSKNYDFLARPYNGRRSRVSTEVGQILFGGGWPPRPADEKSS